MTRRRLLRLAAMLAFATLASGAYALRCIAHQLGAPEVTMVLAVLPLMGAMVLPDWSRRPRGGAS